MSVNCPRFWLCRVNFLLLPAASQRALLLLCAFPPIALSPLQSVPEMGFVHDLVSIENRSGLWQLMVMATLKPPEFHDPRCGGTARNGIYTLPEQKSGNGF
jgi:hypothetical protein